MKATDLMIGDYIQDLAGDLCQVIVIDRQVAQVETLTGVHQGDTTRYLHEAEGVPLTPEILEKNGFVQEKASYAPILYVLYVGHPIYVKASKTVFIEFHENYIGINICHVAGKIRKMDGSIKYVHELQHALRLCGINKEITL